MAEWDFEFSEAPPPAPPRPVVPLAAIPVTPPPLPAAFASPYGAPPWRPAPKRTPTWAWFVIGGAALLFIGAIVAVAWAAHVPRGKMTGHWTLTRSATGRSLNATLDLNPDGTFKHAVSVPGASARNGFRASGTWRLEGRRLILTVAQTYPSNPWNSTEVPWDVRSVDDKTLILHVKEGEQTWARH